MAAIVALAVLACAAPSLAQMPAPQLIDRPIDATWSVPFAAFLKALGVKDQEALLAGSYIFDIGLRQGSIGVRVESEGTCHKDQCLTIIGRIYNRRFVADAMFSAGKRYARSDRTVPVLGAQVFPAWFIGEAMTVTALETERGWLIIPGLVTKQP